MSADWTPAFRSLFRERAQQNLGLDIELSWQTWLLSLIPDAAKARAVHEAGLAFSAAENGDEFEYEPVPNAEAVPPPGEIRALLHAAYGIRTPAAAVALGRSHYTLRQQRLNVMRRYGVHTIEQAVRIAFQAGHLGSLPFL